MTRRNRVWWLSGTLLLLLVACGGETGEPPATEPPRDEPPASTLDEGWTAEVVFENDTALGGCAVGELDPEREGLELIASDQKGRVHLVYRDGGAWKHETLVTMPGELIQCAIGDATRAYPGNEIAAVGMAEGTEDDGGAGIALLLVKDEGGWRRDPVLERTFPALVHGVAITDMDQGGGAETVAVGFDRKATVLSHRGNEWQAIHENDLHGEGKAAVGWRTGVAVAVQGGHIASVLHEAYESNGVGLAGWTLTLTGKGGASQARIDARGEQLLTAQDDGRLVLWTFGADPDLPAAVDREELHVEGQKLRGAALGDFDPLTDGLEAASAGYEGRVVVLVREAAGWTPKVVYRDERSLHHLAHGDVLPDVPGEELLTCGHSGKLVLIRRR